MKFSFEDMFAQLAPKRDPIKIGDFEFFARPMTVAEFSDHINNPDKNARDDLAILHCIEHEDGTPVFNSIEEIKVLYSTVRNELAMAVAAATIFLPPVEVEQSVKETGPNSSNTDK